MNIKLSADKSTIEKAKKYAKKHNTSLNKLLRDYLKKLSDSANTVAIADEFERIALSQSGESEKDFKFIRDEIYTRG